MARRHAGRCPETNRIRWAGSPTTQHVFPLQEAPNGKSREVVLRVSKKPRDQLHRESKERKEMDIEVGDEVTKPGSNFFGRVVQILPEGERTIGVQWSRTTDDRIYWTNGWTPTAYYAPEEVAQHDEDRVDVAPITSPGKPAT
jgi:hypothetical protein